MPTDEELKIAAAKAAADKVIADKVIADKKIADDAAAEVARVAAEKKATDDANTKKILDADGKEIVVKFEMPKLDKDKTYTPEEIQGMVESAFKDGTKKGSVVTKEQLNSEIQKLKDKLSDSGHQTTAETEQLKIKLEAMETAVVDLTNQSNTLSGELVAKDLAVHKATLIAANKGNIVESLIRGNTVEELNASLELAKTEHESIMSDLKTKYKLPDIKNEKEESEDTIELESIDSTGKDKAGIENFKVEREKLLRAAYKKAGVNVP